MIGVVPNQTGAAYEVDTLQALRVSSAGTGSQGRRVRGYQYGESPAWARRALIRGTRGDGEGRGQIGQIGRGASATS